MCSSRQRLKDEAVPSLLLPLKGESKVNESDNVADESNDCEPIIDVIDQDANPSTSINVSLPKTEFSPVKYCHSVSSSPRQGALTDSTAFSRRIKWFKIYYFKTWEVSKKKA